MSHVIKHICKICDEIFETKKRKIKKLFKMKKISQIVLGKGLFVSIKGHFCLTKGHLANVERQLEIKSTSSEVILILPIKIKKKKSKRAFFNKASDLWTLYLSKTVSDRLQLLYALLFQFYSNSDSNQFEFSYLTKPLSTFKVRPSLDDFHSQLSIIMRRYTSVLNFCTDKPSFRFRF